MPNLIIVGQMVQAYVSPPEKLGPSRLVSLQVTLSSKLTQIDRRA